MGKTRLDILNAVKTASEKATIGMHKGEIAKREIRTDSMDVLKYAIKKAGISVQDAIRTMGRMENERKHCQTNNWRKMHGMPMRRKKWKVGGRNARRKRADCY